MTAATRAEVARMALCEVGRPDLAAEIGTNKAGHATRPFWAMGLADAELVARAMRLSNAGDPGYSDWDSFITEVLTRFDSSVTHPRHWSPRRQAWVDDYDPGDWSGASAL